MKNTPLTLIMAGIAALSLCCTSCEDSHDDHGNFTMEDISGNWYGESGNPEVRTTLTLTQSGNKLSGSVTLNNDAPKSVSGSRNGNNVSLTVNGERWTLVLKDPDDLDGFGTAKNGTRYEVDLDRK